MRFSRFGQRFTGDAGILRLMDDLGRALATKERVYMMGGGNPAHIPAVEERFHRAAQRLLDTEGAFERAVGNYPAPQGDVAFIQALAQLLRRELGWNVGPENIALTNGSQTTFFYLFNLFAGEYEDGTFKKILLPLAPEYIGYADVGITPDIFVSVRPDITFLDEHTFKYRVNFDALRVDESIGAIAVSRPTNPTGNVLTDEEISHLSKLAREHGIPFIIDNAYGVPFPHMIFTEAQPIWDDHIVVCMSLSKLGLPGVRTGIIVANEDIIRAVSALNAIISLAPTSMGAALVHELVESGEIIDISRNIIRPYYQRMAAKSIEWLQAELDGLPFYIHAAEGAMFLWLWFRDLPITGYELYERLKERRVIVVPGHYFFPGLQEEWTHKHECIRMTYSQDEESVREGIRIIGDVVRRAYDA